MRIWIRAGKIFPENQAFAEKPRKQSAKSQKHPERRQKEQTLFRIVDKEEEAHGQSQNIQKEKPEKTVKKSRSKPPAQRFLVALHSNIINFF